MGRKNNRSREFSHLKGNFLYGNRNFLRFARAYCALHECYMSAHDIKLKKCNYKKCKHLKEIVR